MEIKRTKSATKQSLFVDSGVSGVSVRSRFPSGKSFKHILKLKVSRFTQRGHQLMFLHNLFILILGIFLGNRYIYIYKI